MDKAPDFGSGDCVEAFQKSSRESYQSKKFEFQSINRFPTSFLEFISTNYSFISLPNSPDFASKKRLNDNGGFQF
ncbi:hypothetical protein CAEBREN_23844 [Caenorhabditis brenneri]|uniref:Uncharacterized protein n=1 Tax=Caenorhabditis brenneri TaxID=135651 RepID=G0MGG4_CAEBE|nr:hypothetical protein CAEBREN_23844 [Caenorhabditis brenneri]